MHLYDHCIIFLAGLTTGLAVFKFGPRPQSSPDAPPPRFGPDLIPAWSLLIPAGLAVILFTLRSLSFANPMTTTPAPRNLQLDALRTAVILAVVCEHVFVVYSTFPGPNPFHYPNSVALVRDGAGWPFWTWLYGVFDTFLMPLAFCLSGIFLPRTMAKYGPMGALRHRLWRLAPPYLLMITLLMPLAYYVPFTLTGHTAPLWDYITRIYWLDGSPSGTSWFLWVLLVFDALTIAALAQPKIHNALKTLATILAHPRAPLFLILAMASVLATQLPPLFFADTRVIKWQHVLGPLYFEKHTIFLHYGWFLFGTAVGLSNTLLDKIRFTSILAPWLCLAFLIIPIPDAPPFPIPLEIRFALTCASALYLSLSTFLLAQSSNPLIRSLANLAPYSFTIYIWHFPLVLWSCFLLLLAPWPALIKFLAAVLASVALILAAATSLTRLRKTQTKGPGRVL